MILRRRLDEEVAARGLAASKQEAAALIMAGKVVVDGVVAAKAGQGIKAGAVVEILAGKRYASRGGDKLAAALDLFNLPVAGKVCLDVGAATGGFTSALLERGAVHVHALDVARGALAWELRRHPRVTVWEGVNARSFDGAGLEPPPQLLTVDVSFISLATVLPPLVATLPSLRAIVSLVKPQFEAAREEVESGGVVRDPGVHQAVLEKTVALFGSLGFGARDVAASPLRGPAGNREFFVWAEKGATLADLAAAVAAATAAAK